MRLIDCYADIFAYILYLLKYSNLGTGFERARSVILDLLDKAEDTGREAGFGLTDMAEAKFAVCAWTDEFVLCSNWPGKVEWQNKQLQRAFFNTNNAGIEFYEHLDKLPDADNAVREVYALCLALGFRGRYFFQTGEGELEQIRKKVLRKTLGLPQGDFSLEDKNRHLFPPAYGAVATRRRFKDFWKFDWYFFFIPVLLIILSVQTWFFLCNDLNIQLLAFFGNLR